jgi:hypothetical protein
VGWSAPFGEADSPGIDTDGRAVSHSVGDAVTITESLAVAEPKPVAITVANAGSDGESHSPHPVSVPDVRDLTGESLSDRAGLGY